MPHSPEIHRALPHESVQFIKPGFIGHLVSIDAAIGSPILRALWSRDEANRYGLDLHLYSRFARGKSWSEFLGTVLRAGRQGKREQFYISLRRGGILQPRTKTNRHKGRGTARAAVDLTITSRRVAELFHN